MAGLEGPGQGFENAAEAVSWGGRALEGVCPDGSLAARESRWMLEAAAVAAGRDPLFLRRPEITPRVAAVFRSHVARRSRGEPLAYVVGEASFRGIDLFVTADVLIPRPETEQLVEVALEEIPRDTPWCILDQGAGSGAIGIALAIERPAARVTCVEISPSAADLARRNVARHGLAERVEIVEADLYPPGGGTFDAIVANLPYVPDGAVLPEDVAAWEPARALRGGPTGREIIERSIELADDRVRAGGLLMYEIGEDQREGFERRWPERFRFRADLAGRTRFMTGRR